MPEYRFGNSSKDKLRQCHPKLIGIMQAALKASDVDFGITEGFRDKETQNRYFETGRSKVKFPKGAHNKTPSLAVDVVAYVNGKPTYEMHYYLYLYGVIQTCARIAGYQIRSGLNWDMDGEIMTDQTFNDGCHFELSLQKE